MTAPHNTWCVRSQLFTHELCISALVITQIPTQTDIVSMKINKRIPLCDHYKAIELDPVTLCYDMCSSLPVCSSLKRGNLEIMSGQHCYQWKKDETIVTRMSITQHGGHCIFNVLPFPKSNVPMLGQCTFTSIVPKDAGVALSILC